VPTATIQNVEDLATLPILRKKDLAAFFESVSNVRGGSAPALFIHSSGTTGPSTFRLRSKEELQFIWQFFSRVRGGDAKTSSLLPACLVIDVQDHGGAVALPANAFAFTIKFWDKDRLEYAIRLLTETPKVPGVRRRIEYVAAGTDVIQSLTTGLLRRGIDPARLGVRSVSVGGEFLPSARYKWLRQAWKAVVLDRWSCSEVFGSACRRREDAPFVFDANLVVEVVDPVTRRPVSSGAGFLVLTELFPFSQLQTLVRFEVGDLVQIRSAATPDRFDFLGRAAGAVFHPDGRLLVAETELVETLHDLPWVARQTEADIGHGVEPALPASYAARWLKTGGRPRVQLEVDVKFDPVLFPDAAREYAAMIRQRLIRRAPRLTAALTRREIDTEVRLREVQRPAHPPAFSS